MLQGAKFTLDTTGKIWLQRLALAMRLRVFHKIIFSYVYASGFIQQGLRQGLTPFIPQKREFRRLKKVFFPTEHRRKSCLESHEGGLSLGLAGILSPEGRFNAIIEDKHC
jgi:hypothetical protein